MNTVSINELKPLNIKKVARTFDRKSILAQNR